MAGHSKFKNIMHRKGAQDARRAKMFTKVGREIFVAAKLGGADPASNPRLRTAIAEARVVNMPNDRIKRAIESATGAGNAEDYEEVRYEGYGPGGVALIVSALTDNRNRTASEVRAAFTKSGGALGETNSVSFMFEKIGEIAYPLAKASSEAMFEAAAEAGAQDCDSSGESHIIKTSPEDFSAVRDALEKKYGAAEKAGLTWSPKVMTPADEETARSVMKLIDILEDSDDVQSVVTNLDASDDVMERLLNS